MDGYIALKNAIFNGTEYLAGAVIPAEAVLPSRVPALLRNNVIMKAKLPERAAAEPADPAEETQKKPTTKKKGR